MGFQIAIDGPAGAGKSTIAKKVAEALRFLYIDTGAMYRAVAWAALQKGVALEEESVASMLPDLDIRLCLEEGKQRVYVQEKDVSDAIRNESISMAASKVSTYGRIRRDLVRRQQAMAGETDVVMDGRDIGTVVLPEAALKIFLTASVAVRAKRRLLEYQQKGETGSLAMLEQEIRERDLQDSTRKESPLKQAEDAVYIDSSDLSVEEVTEMILTLARERLEK